MRRFTFALLSFVLAVAAQPLVAATYYVGTCKARAYGTIGAAVAAVPAGSTIDVCPGTYPEQVVISRALTLQGIISNSSSQAIITVPSSGLATTSSIHWGTVAAQVEVTAGPVKITNITVDGTTGSSNCPSSDYIGIFYSSGSSGTVNGVETRNQNCNIYNGTGIGIWAENGAGASESVTIENNNVNNNSSVGIGVCSNQTPSTLTVSIQNNYVAGGVAGGLPYFEYGIDVEGNVGGSVSGNTVGPAGAGINAGSPSISVSKNTVNGGSSVGIYLTGAADVSDNTINGANFGVLVGAAGSVTSNNLSNNSAYGIYIQVNDATVEKNIIFQTWTGIELLCKTGTVSGNTINGATKVGLDSVPAGFTGVNNLYNVATTTTDGCS